MHRWVWVHRLDLVLCVRSCFDKREQAQMVLVDFLIFWYFRSTSIKSLRLRALRVLGLWFCFPVATPP